MPQFFLDHELRIRRFTPVAEKLLNLSVKDIDRPLLNIRHELIEAEEIKNDTHCVLKAEIPVEKELVQSDKRSFLYRILPYRDENGQVRGVVLCFTETTKLREVENAFIESEARFRAAVEAVNDAVWSYSIEEKLFEFSLQWFKILGIKAERLFVSLDSLLKLVHEDDKPAFIKTFETSLLDSGEFALEFRVLNGNGNYIWISSRGRCIEHDQFGKPKTVMGTNSDISIRKQLELQRLKQQQLISLVCDGIGLGFWNFDLVSETLEVDDVFRAITGFEDFVVSFDEFYSNCHPDDSDSFFGDIEKAQKRRCWIYRHRT